MKKKVCHISTVHRENDNRILFKQCSSIKKAGYDVSLIITSDKKKKVNGVEIVPLAKRNGRIERLLYRRNEAYRKALELDADIYHFHDPELIPIGRKLIKKGKIVIYDVHEDVPKQILSKSYLGPNWIKKIISFGFNKYEKHHSRNFSAIVTILDELKDEFTKYNKNVISVKNYAIKDIIDESTPIINDKKDEFIILYIGAITEIRGIKEMIKATECFNGNVKLWLAGQWESDELRQECESFKGYSNTVYLGDFKAKDLYKFVKSADVGLSVLHPIPNYKKAIPTKVIEYMACELPVILSDFPFWKELFGDIGSYVDPLDIQEISNAIEGYMNNKDKITEIGIRNRKKYINNFCWDSEEKKLLKLYNDLLEA
ncbi:MAG: glycosyltransferase family 4 protein [Clostridium sartagoforme]|nr:glycosyltransferase family 4 protein [Clostridium sartagoforme]